MSFDFKRNTSQMQLVEYNSSQDIPGEVAEECLNDLDHWHAEHTSYIWEGEMLLDVEDTKDAVYGTLDAWVAWEQNFPIAPLKNVLLALEREQQWHRVVQVIKWMLSKGQGNTIGTYQQLIHALDMDHRAEEAHNFWMKKIGNDFHSVPWQTCHVMISVYYRNNMLDHLVKGAIRRRRELPVQRGRGKRVPESGGGGNEDVTTNSPAKEWEVNWGEAKRVWVLWLWETEE
ncbi:hypothetical protein Cgig2_003213 [Carnegiea gigantea]|uniref:Pentatricopeptide repeat-containing protein n=1 Tax=Carnegiea gigantea TaxID=171969 RepID=A0A9Q1QDA3_9CARY|nr:hypothetical protein Cgig2_003213 [Carnegiea gigantea]